MEINLNKYSELDIYVKNGKECYLDNLFYSKKLRWRTPEEEVRQKIICWLLNDINVPNDMIKVEESLSHYSKNDLRRADICVFYNSENSNEDNVLLVIECKRNEKFLSDDVFEQAKYYAKKIKSPFFAITNGTEIVLYKISSDENNIEIVDLNTFPQYQELCCIDNVNTKPLELYKHSKVYNEYLSSHEMHTILLNKEYIGVKTPIIICSIIAKLIDVLYDDRERLRSLNGSSYEFIEDIGVRYTSFGNSSGGSWDGLYRSFLIKDECSNYQIVSLGILASINEHTYLNVAIDDFDKSHNSIQINLDKNLCFTKGEVELIHNGSMTKGKNGAVKRDLVKNYIKENSELKVNNDIMLCKFKDVINYSINDHALINMLSNLIEYALLRDKLRNMI